MKNLKICIVAGTLGVLLALAVWSAPEARRNVTVRIKGLVNREGQLLASLFVAPEGFPSESKKSFRSHALVISGTDMSVTFTNVPMGKCAVGVCHDQNKSGSMDSTLFGRPKEGYGVSMQTDKLLGPPSFDQACFNISTQDVSIEIEMIYP